MSEGTRRLLPDSQRTDALHRAPVQKHRTDPNERFEVTLRLKPATPLPSQPLPLNHEEWLKAHGYTAGSYATVEKFAKDHQLVVVEQSAARRTVILSGRADDLSKAFGADLYDHYYQGSVQRRRSGFISLPAEVADVVEGVFGLDNRPQAKPHFRVRATTRDHDLTLEATASTAKPLTPVQLAKLYDFPAGLDGTGQCIALIELGGGFRPGDIATYFAKLGLTVPNVVAVNVGHGRNRPGSADGPDGEVMLDIEVAAAIAPKAKICVYFADNTDAGFLNAITQAIHDPINKPSVISISWGGPEAYWTRQAMAQFSQAFQAAAALGITITVASGDDGSSDGINDGKSHADFPGSSPYALCCGGTRVLVNNTLLTETVWNNGAQGGASGGGMSTFFARPSYQAATLGSYRNTPDVAGDADPDSGYIVRVDGQDLVIGGTSAVAPLYAGLVALLNQKLGKRVGFLHPKLYATPAIFRDVTVGTNGAYAAKPGYDNCTGLGVIDGTKLLQSLSS